MDSLNRSTPTLANRRRKPVVSGMAPLGELERNPVAFTVTDGAGPHSIAAERGASGKVWMTCQCAASLSDGWCRHRIDLLCFRYEAAATADATTKRAFEQIVTGTALSDAGRDADRSLSAFGGCLTVFDERRPVDIVGADLGKFTDLVSDLAACASELEDSLGRLRRLLERD